MAPIFYNLLSSSALISYGLYHLISSIISHLKSPLSFSAKPFHPFPHPRFHNLPIHLLIFSLLISFIHQIILSFEDDSLIKGNSPVHHFLSLQFSSLIFLFIVLSLCILFSESPLFPFSNDFLFAFASLVFFLHYSVASSTASVQISELEAKCDAVSAKVSAFAAFMCGVLAFQPRLFAADVALGGALVLKGFWVLQTGLSLYVDAFIPEGCHRMLDVADGVEGSTKCVLDESKFRALAVLDLLFLFHVMIVVFLVFITYACIARGVGNRRLGAYDSLPNASSDNHSIIQMKALTGTQA